MSQQDAIRCSDVVELISDYLENALSSDQRVRVEEHLAGCEGCAMVLDQFRETIRLTGMLREDQLSDRQRSTLLGAFRSWRSGSGSA